MNTSCIPPTPPSSLSLIFTLTLTTSHIPPAMKYQCLLSVGQFCDNGFDVHVNLNNIFLEKGKKSLLGTATPIPHTVPTLFTLQTYTLHYPPPPPNFNAYST